MQFWLCVDTDLLGIELNLQGLGSIFNLVSYIFSSDHIPDCLVHFSLKWQAPFGMLHPASELWHEIHEMPYAELVSVSVGQDTQHSLLFCGTWNVPLSSKQEWCASEHHYSLPVFSYLVQGGVLARGSKNTYKKYMQPWSVKCDGSTHSGKAARCVKQPNDALVLSPEGPMECAER